MYIYTYICIYIYIHMFTYSYIGTLGGMAMIKMLASYPIPQKYISPYLIKFIPLFVINTYLYVLCICCNSIHIYLHIYICMYIYTYTYICIYILMLTYLYIGTLGGTAMIKMLASYPIPQSYISPYLIKYIPLNL
jgi:hypothetical protein